MEQKDKNILFRKVPEGMSNIVKGILLLFPAVFVSGLVWAMLAFTNFCGSMECTEYNLSSYANPVAGLVFLLFIVWILRVMFGPIKGGK